MKTPAPSFTLDQLCALVGLPRRTVRYYLQHGLVDRPEGAGRGAHYTQRHLEQLLTIQKWKQAGLSLERIQDLLAGQTATVPPAPVRPGQVEVWSRVHLADGLELHVEPTRAGLSPERLRALVRQVLALYEQTRTQEEGP
jgi:DNA-binding transcriptional MerR regulator